MPHQLTTCTFCGVGCGIYLESSGNEIIGTYPSMSHPTNKGRICVRGWHVHEVSSSPDRLTRPLVRKNRGADFEETDWNTAYDFVAKRLTEIRASHGPDSIGFLNSARCSNEESYLLQKLARTAIGTNNVDHGTGIHRIRTIDVLLEMLGVPAATTSIGDIEQSDVIVVDAIDLARQLPTVGGHVLRAKLAGAKLIVTGPRRHRIAEEADLFLQSRSGTDSALFGAMAKVIVDRGLADLAFIKAHCRDYEAFLEAIAAYDILWASSVCGVEPSLIEEAAILFGRAKAGMILYSTGAEARGEESVQTIVNLALLTGNLGKPGAGVMPLCEHNNLQGVCDVGMTPEYLPGYRALDDAAARRGLEALWGAKIPESAGLDARSMVETRGRGKLKALWLGRHDPVVSATFCDASTTLRDLDFIVCQHLFMTESARLSDVVLPVVAFGEEQVTFTSTERRIQLTAKALEPPAGPVPAWKQIVEVAGRLGAKWSYASAAEVMNEIGQAVPFYEAADYANLARDHGRQWPCTNDRPLGTRFLFGDRRADRDKTFRFVPIGRYAETVELPSSHPFGLIFGHSLFYWHSNVLIQHSEVLKREYRILLLDYPEGFVDLNDEDARELNVRDGQKVRLVTTSGRTATTAARVTREVRRGMVFAPYFLHEAVQQLLDASTTDLRRRSLPLPVRVEKA